MLMGSSRGLKRRGNLVITHIGGFTSPLIPLNLQVPAKGAEVQNTSPKRAEYLGNWVLVKGLKFSLLYLRKPDYSL